MTETIESDASTAGESETKKAREVTGTARYLAMAVAVIAGVYHVYTAGFGTPGAFINRPLHLAFVTVLAFLLFPGRSGDTEGVPWYDWLLMVVSVPSILYIAYAIEFGTLASRSGDPLTRDIVFGAITILAVLEITRRATGLILPMIASSFLLYAYYGRYMPQPIIHRGYTVERIISHSYLTTEGIFGIPLGVSATFVVVFIILGAFLEVTGIGDWFIDLAYGATGRTTGGPAKTSVMASGFLASLNGSAVANTATTGAFIMSSWTGIPYVTIIAAASIPALLYFLSIGAAVHFRAKREGLEGVPAEDLPDPWKLLKTGFHFLIPLIVLVVLLVQGNSAMKAAFYAIVLTVIVAIPRDRATEFVRALGNGDTETIRSLVHGACSLGVAAMERGMRMTITVAAACATAGLVVGMVTLTGLGLKFSTLITSLSGGVLIVALILTMLTSIILGMGLPTTAAYVVLAALGAPALKQMGVELIAAHLFIFYFGIISAITPPIMLAVFTASGIAESHPWKTGLTALNLAAAGFLVPYMFVYGPQLLLIGSTTMIVISATTAIVGILALSAGTQGYFYTSASYLERIALVVGAVVLIAPGLLTDLAGFAIITAVFLKQYVVNQPPEIPTPTGVD
ncbi:TRAP transporter fused permease subunit [Haladaptatus sp. DYF46]|uniref:TRAP transporter permease n=1 Tax=Haladaptatus sp. DYF46 TaxID=2886041 RepID=UPI001E2F8FA9|nr:TRAP transporter fused permease subunit [Haladaptatus sp. DYF46]